MEWIINNLGSSWRPGEREARWGTDWDDEENLAGWRRLGELDLEAGLREGGCPEVAVKMFCDWDRSTSTSKTLYLVARDPSRDPRLTTNARAAFLALVGRTTRADWTTINLRSNGTTGYELAALCANLASNTKIETLCFFDTPTVGTVNGCTLLGKALKTNSTIRVLDLRSLEVDRYAVKFLMNGLQENNTLLSLTLFDNPLFDEGTKVVADFLRTNRSLKVLDIRRVECGSEGANYIASALETNTILEELSLGVPSGFPHPFERDVLKKLLEPFCPDVKADRGRQSEMPSEVPKNTTVKKLSLEGEYSDCVEELARFIKMNTSLSSLRIWHARLTPKQWKDNIFPALKENNTLRELELNLCYGLTEVDVQDALIHLLRSNKIELTAIRFWSRVGEDKIRDLQRQVNEELRKNSEYRIKLRDQPTVQGKTGRLILCGFGYAGKTAICKTMEAIDQGKSRSYSFLTFWKRSMQIFPGLQRLLFGKDAYKDVTGRTRGFDVLSLQRQQYLKFIWDFAGQKAYYALHDYMFPDTKNSCILYVCSCRCPPSPENPQGEIKSQDTMKAECEYWMKFIVSNSEPHSDKLSHVTFVMTHKDTLTSGELKISRHWAQRVVRDLKIVFQDVLLLSETVEVVDSHSFEDINRLLSSVDKSLKKILEHQTEYALCEEVRYALAAQPSQSPIMTCHEFLSMSAGRFRFEDSPMEIREAIMTYLNDLGEVIFPKGFEFLVTNPRWFGVKVLGVLIDSLKGGEDVLEDGAHPGCTNLCCASMKPLGLLHEKGIVDRIDVKCLLEDSLQMAHLQQSISFEKLIDLMIHLELCFESQPGNVNSSLFFPALFDDDKEAAAKGERQLEWRLEQKEPLQYIGRRLECHNKATTFLTPGFFPRLQVHLRNYFYKNQWTENPGFAVDRNLICFAHNGIEILVEYSGDIDYFIDVLVRSSQSRAAALDFVNEHVMRKVQDFCALQKGCQGVILVEAVIRKVCVEELHLCKDRKAHSVVVSTLDGGLKKDPLYKHTWSHPIADQEDTDFAVDLLQGEHPHKKSVESPETSSLTVCRPGHADQFPTLFYPSIEDVGVLDRLNIRLNLSKKMPIKLHLMCDHKDGHHVLESQPGRTISVNRKGGGYDVPILKLAVTLLWTGVGVASSMSGASLAVPKVDSWIQSLFNVCEMPDINEETLHEMMNRGKTSKAVGEQDILKALARYWKLDPQSLGLKQILNVQDSAKFWNDFQLRKVVYTEAPNQDNIGWVCDRHYWPGLKKGILHSV